MSSSRYVVNNISFGEVKDNYDFESFINNSFNPQEHEYLLHDERFITMLLSNPNVFRDFSYTHFNDDKITSVLFSKENVHIIKSINEAKLIKSLDYIMNLEKCYTTFLEDHNYYLLCNNLNSHSFLLPLLEYANEGNVANEFIIKHPEYISNHSLYSKVKVSNPINKENMQMLLSIKEFLHIEGEDSFYSKFSNEVISSLVDSGYYGALSEIDKKQIINNRILYTSNYNSPLSSNLFKNKDFFENICKVTQLDSKNIIKVLNYLKINQPEIYDTYNYLFKNLIKDKKNKDKDDVSYLFFDDYFENVKLNIEIIKNYVKSNEIYRSKLDSDTLEILSSIDFDNINNKEDIINVYNKLNENNINYNDLIYDYVSLARDTFASDVKNSLSSPSNCNQHDNYEGVNIHYYEGEPLSFVVHSSAIKSGAPESFATNRVKKLESSNQISKYLSTSYINENNLCVYEDEAIIYGFNNLDNMHLVSAHYSDAFTSNNLDSPINRPSTYANLEEFSNHNSYSELVFKTGKLKPNCIVCFDKVDDYDLEVARKLNVDIVCINRKKYKNDKNKEISKNKNRYINY